MYNFHGVIFIYLIVKVKQQIQKQNRAISGW